MTYLFNNKREDLLRFLPKNAVVAEIGVAHGDFSAQILEQSSPERLYLIDPWVHQDDGDYQVDHVLYLGFIDICLTFYYEE